MTLLELFESPYKLDSSSLLPDVVASVVSAATVEVRFAVEFAAFAEFADAVVLWSCGAAVEAGSEFCWPKDKNALDVMSNSVRTHTHGVRKANLVSHRKT